MAAPALNEKPAYIGDLNIPEVINTSPSILVTILLENLRPIPNRGESGLRGATLYRFCSDLTGQASSPVAAIGILTPSLKGSVFEVGRCRIRLSAAKDIDCLVT